MGLLDDAIAALPADEQDSLAPFLPNWGPPKGARFSGTLAHGEWAESFKNGVLPQAAILTAAAFRVTLRAFSVPGPVVVRIGMTGFDWYDQEIRLGVDLSADVVAAEGDLPVRVAPPETQAFVDASGIHMDPLADASLKADIGIYALVDGAAGDPIPGATAQVDLVVEFFSLAPAGTVSLQ